MRKPTVGHTESRQILANIQVLRAAAAMLVVLHHTKAMMPGIGLPTKVLSFAALGVDLFFVISGFIMVLTTDVARTGGLRFMENRVARVVPLYWVMTLLVFALALTVPGALGTRPSGADLARSLAFIPYPRVDGTMQPVLFLGWSLNYEMFFYLVFACAIAASRAMAHRVGHVTLAVGAIGLLVLGGFVLQPAGATIGAFYSNPKMIEFIVGMLVARGLPYIRGERGWAVVGVVVGFVWLAATPSLFADAASTFSATGAATLILLSALAAERGGLVARWPLIVLLGNASYSLYLVHPLVTQVAVHAWQRLGGMALGAPVTLAVMLVTLLLAAAVAIATYRLVETPLSRLARRALGVRRPAIPAGGL